MKTTRSSRVGQTGVITLSVLALFVGLSFGQVRQAPFCVDDELISQELLNFEDIFAEYRKNPQGFVAVSPNGEQSPSGFIKIGLSHITTLTPYLPEKHPWRVLNNFIHITIEANNKTDGMEGLYIQAISAPLGVPFGEFVANFDCHDCKNPPSAMEPYTAIIGCAFRPAASYIHPTVLVIGGKTIPPKFHEAHFNFRYVDYPCFDVMYAQFLILAVRQFKPTLLYETFYTVMYQTNIEGIGAPSPMYYGWPTKDIDCHDPAATSMDNWFPQKNSKMKIKFNEEYDRCVVSRNATFGYNVCPPGPVTCGADKKNSNKPPKTVSQWKRMRSNYLSQEVVGTMIFCRNCGNYTVNIGDTAGWEPPEANPDPADETDISIKEITIKKTIRVKPRFQGANCETRDGFGKTVLGGRDVSKDKAGCELDFKIRLVSAGYRWGQRSLYLHGLLMIFAFTIGTNCLVYCARFQKEANIIDKGSGCWGIGNWLWLHFFWTYLSGSAMWAGFTMYAFQKKKVVCQLYNSKEDTDFCNRTIFSHKLLGTVAVFLMHVSYATGWVRPKEGRIRKILLFVHTVTGYLPKYLAYICMILIPPSSDDWVSITLITLLEVSFWVAFLIATRVQLVMDKKLHEDDRKMCPLPEGIATHSDPPLGKVRGLLFQALLIVQIGLYMALFLYTLRHYVRVNHTPTPDSHAHEMHEKE